jgi:RimJ/RimL family protein N-acetyltransferase
MNDQSLVIYESPHYQLRAINRGDIEYLRLWKNFNKQFFFLSVDITAEQQETWFEGFITRNNDYMFIVEEIVDGDRFKIGCMGFRVKDNVVDVYNIMRGQPSMKNMFTMSQAFLLMIMYASKKKKLPITCIVLKSNPALGWYAKNGFEVNDDIGDSLLLRMNDEFLKLKNINFKVVK